MANPSSSSDPFELLGLQPAFDVDLAALERAFFERSKAVHPDKVAGAPAAERVAQLTKARALNDAYQLVKKPVPRAEYLLARAGLAIGDNERLDPTQIMEVLEAREELAASRGDAAKVEKLQAGMQERRRAAVEQLSALFAANDHEGVKRVLINLRYIDRYLEECDAALSEDD